MKYKIGDIVTSKYLAAGLVGRITEFQYSSWSGKVDYRLVVEGIDTHYCFYEDDLELVEAPAQDYLDLFT